MGASTGQCELVRAGYWIAKRFRRERFANHFLRRGRPVETITRIPFGVRLENAINSYTVYVLKAFWPVRLTIYYPYPYRGIAVWRVFLGAIFLLTITGSADDY